MPQFLIPPGKRSGETVVLSAEESHHLREVLRISKGESVFLFDGQGSRYRGEIRSISKSEVVISVLEKLPPERSNAKVFWAQALLKGDKMERVIEKAAELGIHTMHPYSSARTIASWRRPEKLRRWQRIADEAAKQCGRASRMTVAPPAKFTDLLAEVRADSKIIFWEGGGGAPREFFSKRECPETLLALIGPEGGFSGEEVRSAVGAGFVPLSLGPRILRVETASIVAMGLVQYELGNI